MGPDEVLKLIRSASERYESVRAALRGAILGTRMREKRKIRGSARSPDQPTWGT